MADLLLDLIELLTNRGIVAGDGVDCFRDYMPDEPDAVITFQEYSGNATAPHVTSVSRRVQITVRGTPQNANDARIKAWQIFNSLDQPSRILDSRSEIPAGTRWGMLFGLQVPHKMRVDKSNRVVYGFNIALITTRD